MAPDAETMSAIYKGLDIICRMTGTPPVSMVRIVLRSETARRAGIEPVRDVEDPKERTKASLRTQEQADAVLGLLRVWYAQIKRNEKQRRRR